MTNKLSKGKKNMNSMTHDLKEHYFPRNHISLSMRTQSSDITVSQSSVGFQRWRRHVCEVQCPRLPHFEFIYMPWLCKTFKHSPSSVSVAERSKGASLWYERLEVRIPLEKNFLFWYFCFRSVPHSSAKAIQIKSSRTFIQGNRCMEIDIVLKKDGGGL